MKRRILTWLTAGALVLGMALAFCVALPKPLAAAPVPELLITEIVPASAGTGQPYEYVEIFNTTAQPINLGGYKLLYYTASPYATPANRWTIADKVIPARSALVLWLKKFDYPNVPLADFNANYGTTLTPDQVFEVKLTTSAQGLHDSSKRRVAIARADEVAISAAYINDGVADGSGNLNKGVTYKYNNTVDMLKVANGQPATPGLVLPAQMPPQNEDTTPPAVPTGLAAAAGAGEVTLTWQAVTDADLAGYRIYQNGALKGTVPATQTSFTLAKLAGGTYEFAVSALDKLGNESAKSAPVTASPTHERITQQERGTSQPDLRYTVFRNISQMGAVVPGLVEDLVPQGTAWWPEQQWLVTSHYVKDGRPSVLTFVDANTGALVKSLRMYEENGAPYVGHAGGLAVSRENLWVASGSFVYRIPLANLAAAPDNGNITFANRFAVETNASFVAYDGGVLWVGEFYHPSAGYNTAPSHQLTNRMGAPYGAWIAGYRFDTGADQPAGAAPDYIFAIRNQIQGMALTPDRIMLSRSYGRKNDSHLFAYSRPDLSGAPHQTVPVAGQTVPVWFLDETTQAAVEPVVVLPPLAEGIVTDGADRLFVLFESGANEYRFDGFNPLDRFAVVSLDQWNRYGAIRIAGVPERLEVGETAAVQVLRFWGNQGEADVTAAAAFSMADPVVASAAVGGTVTALAQGDTTLMATVEGRTAEAKVHVVTVQSAALTGPAERKVTVGEPVPLTVIATYSDGSTKDVTAQAAFSMEHGGKASVRNGVLVGEKPGDIRVTASYKGVPSGEVRVIVSPAEAGAKK